MAYQIYRCFSESLQLNDSLPTPYITFLFFPCTWMSLWQQLSRSTLSSSMVWLADSSKAVCWLILPYNSLTAAQWKRKNMENPYERLFPLTVTPPQEVKKTTLNLKWLNIIFIALNVVSLLSACLSERHVTIGNSYIGRLMNAWTDGIYSVYLIKPTFDKSSL